MWYFCACNTNTVTSTFKFIFVFLPTECGTSSYLFVCNGCKNTTYRIANTFLFPIDYVFQRIQQAKQIPTFRKIYPLSCPYITCPYQETCPLRESRGRMTLIICSLLKLSEMQNRMTLDAWFFINSPCGNN